jgi:hypothetical protein
LEEEPVRHKLRSKKNPTGSSRTRTSSQWDNQQWSKPHSNQVLQKTLETQPNSNPSPSPTHSSTSYLSVLCTLVFAHLTASTASPAAPPNPLGALFRPGSHSTPSQAPNKRPLDTPTDVENPHKKPRYFLCYQMLIFLQIRVNLFPSLSTSRQISFFGKTNYDIPGATNSRPEITSPIQHYTTLLTNRTTQADSVPTTDDIYFPTFPSYTTLSRGVCLIGFFAYITSIISTLSNAPISDTYNTKGHCTVLHAE